MLNEINEGVLQRINAVTFSRLHAYHGDDRETRDLTSVKIKLIYYVPVAQHSFQNTTIDLPSINVNFEELSEAHFY